MKSVKALFVVASLCMLVGPASAERSSRNSVARSGLSSVCPASKIRQIGNLFFYKNNKPIRQGTNGPVIGNNPVITLAGQPGRGPRIFGGSGYLHATNGTRLATLTPYPCKADHCTGRVVSSAGTASLRQAAVRASRSAAGYVKVGGICVFIPDIGRCYGQGVNTSRPLCDRTVK